MVRAHAAMENDGRVVATRRIQPNSSLRRGVATRVPRANSQNWDVLCSFAWARGILLNRSTPYSLGLRNQSYAESGVSPVQPSRRPRPERQLDQADALRIQESHADVLVASTVVTAGSS